MKITFQIRWAAIKAASYIVSQDATRYALGGVNLEITGQSSAVIAATDGRKLFACKEAIEIIEQDGEFIGSVIIPKSLIAIAKIQGLPKATPMATITIDGKRITISCPKTGLSFGGTAIDGNFPAWREVVPKAPLLDNVAMVVNPHYLEDFRQAFLTLSGKKAICLRFTQPESPDGLSPFLVTTSYEPEAIGVLMPMRDPGYVSGTTKAPAWSLPAPKEAPKSEAVAA